MPTAEHASTASDAATRPSDHVTFADLATAAYCPRKLYYARRGDRAIPDEVERARALAFEYETLLEADDAALADGLVSVPADVLHRNLDRTRDRFPDVWPALLDPAERYVLLTGRDCRGFVQKVLALDPPVPTLVSPGEPPPQGVWGPQSVRAVAAAKALAWREGCQVDRAFVEYPTRGIVREVTMTTRRRAAYRTALRAVRALDGPPPRLDNRAKCESCEYSDECGVKTRSLRSLLGV